MSRDTEPQYIPQIIPSYNEFPEEYFLHRGQIYFSGWGYQTCAAGSKNPLNYPRQFINYPRDIERDFEHPPFRLFYSEAIYADDPTGPRYEVWGSETKSLVGKVRAYYPARYLVVRIERAVKDREFCSIGDIYGEHCPGPFWQKSRENLIGFATARAQEERDRPDDLKPEKFYIGYIQAMEQAVKIIGLNIPDYLKYGVSPTICDERFLQGMEETLRLIELAWFTYEQTHESERMVYLRDVGRHLKARFDLTRQEIARRRELQKAMP